MSRHSVLINGKAEGHIVPEKGLRQGDPLSPYLFILFAEVLPHMMMKAMEDRSLLGVKITLKYPSVNHLLFADDSYSSLWRMTGQSVTNSTS